VSVVDTNVLVYSSATGSPHHARARAAIAQLASEGPVAVTRQILREYLAATTRVQSWSRAFTLAEAVADTEEFARRFVVLEDGLLVWEKLSALTRQFAFGGKQVRLLTFNVTDFQRFDSVIELVMF